MDRGTHLEVWQSSANYYFDRTSEIDNAATSSQYVYITAGTGFQTGLYGIGAVNLNYSAPGTNADGTNLFALGRVNPDGSQYTGTGQMNPIATVAVPPQTGATWFYGTTVADVMAKVNAAQPAPVYSWTEPAVNTALTSIGFIQADGDSRVQYQGNRLQAELQRLFPNAAIQVNNGGAPGALTSAFLPGTARYTQLVQFLKTNNVKLYFLSTGVNDSKDSVATTPDLYQTETQQIVDALYTDVPTLRAVVLGEPFYSVPGSGGGDFDAAANTRQTQYIARQQSITRAIPMGGLDSFFRANPSKLIDGLHPSPGDGSTLTPPYPNNDGQAAEVSNWATGIANALANLPANQPVVTQATNTNPNYDSPPSNEVTVTAGYVPNAPIILSYSGRGTFANPQVSLTWAAGTWGRINIERLTVGATGAAGTYAIVGTEIASTVGDPTTVPTTHVDTTVVNGVTYKYRLVADPS